MLGPMRRQHIVHMTSTVYRSDGSASSLDQHDDTSDILIELMCIVMMRARAHKALVNVVPCVSIPTLLNVISGVRGV